MLTFTIIREDLNRAVSLDFELGCVAGGVHCVIAPRNRSLPVVVVAGHLGSCFSHAQEGHTELIVVGDGKKGYCDDSLGYPEPKFPGIHFRNGHTWGDV